MKREVVADSTALIGLSGIGHLSLLRSLFGTVVVPPAVWREVVVEGRGRPGASETREAAAHGWVTKRRPRSRACVRRLVRLFGIAAGETEVICLGTEIGTALLLIDDPRAARHAMDLGLRVARLPAVLLRARQRGLVGTLRPLLDGLKRLGFGIDPEHEALVLRHAGETS